MAFTEFTGQLDQEQSAGPVREFSGELDVPAGSGGVMQPSQAATPEPSTAAVAVNAVPKMVANTLNIPHALNGLVMRGLASLPGLDAVPEVKSFLQNIADNPEFNRNRPMEFMQKIGAVRPENEPQNKQQRIVDSAIQAAGSAFLTGGGLPGLVLGAISGTTSQAIKEKTGSDVLAAATGIVTPYAIGKAINAGVGLANKIRGTNKKVLLEETGKQTFQDARQMGFVMEPSKIRSGSDAVESVAGKAKVQQETIEFNGPLFTMWTKRAIGLPDDTPLSMELLDTYKKTVIKPYREIDNLFQQAKATGNLPWFPRYHSQSLTDEFVQASQDAQSLKRAYRLSQVKDNNLLKEAKAAEARADAVLDDIEMVANHIGVQGFGEKILEAKQLYAQVNDVQTALNPGSGHVSPETIALIRSESEKMTGILRTLGDIVLLSPRSFKDIERSAPSGVSGTDAGMGATLATMGSAAAGSPLGAATGGLPFLREPAARKVLSPEFQDSLTDAAKKKWPKVPTAGMRGAVVGATSSRQENKQ